MDRIVIEVGDGLAKRWRNTSLQIRQQISQELDQFLNTIFEKKKTTFGHF